VIRPAVIAAVTLLNFRAPRRAVVQIPKPRRYETTPLPHISEDLAKFKPKPKTPVVKKRTSRKKHVCAYSHGDMWGAFLFGLILGGFAIYIFL
jgi:hypothetical protein